MLWLLWVPLEPLGWEPLAQLDHRAQPATMANQVHPDQPVPLDLEILVPLVPLVNLDFRVPMEPQEPPEQQGPRAVRAVPLVPLESLDPKAM